MRRQRIRQELQYHLDARAAELESAGVSPAEAQRRAAAELGTLEPVLEEAHGSRPGRWARDAARDVRLALRSWRRRPGFAVLALVVLAVGLGANAVMFALVQATLLRPLPYRNGGRGLVWMTEVDNHGVDQSFSFPDYLDYQKLGIFSSFGGYRDLGIASLIGGRTLLGHARLVSAGLLETLGVAPERGRWFDAHEHRHNGPPAVIVSDAFWRGALGARPAAVGSVLRTNIADYTVVGVMPPSFQFGAGIEMWLPYEEVVPAGYMNNRANSYVMYGVGRLRPGVNLKEAKAAVAALSARLARQYPASNLTVHGTIESLRDQLFGGVRTSLWMLFAAVGALLLIVCANLANLLLARAAGRSGEMAVRAALGADKWRQARQLLAEGLLLSLVGASAGVALSWFGLGLMASGLPADYPIHGALALDGRVAGFALVLSLATGVLFSLAPMALAMRMDLSSALRARGAAGARHRIHRLLVVAEVTVAMVLLTSGALMLRSLQKLSEVPLGLNPLHVLTETVSVSNAYKTRAQTSAFFARLQRHAAALPGVESAALVFPVPFSVQIADAFLAIEGRPADPQAPITTHYANVDYNYFHTLQIPLIAGRLLRPADDTASARPVAVIDRSLAVKYWGTPAAAVGKRMQLFTETFGHGPVPADTVVGVVGAIKAVGADAPPNLEVYMPLPFPNWTMTLLLRTGANPDALAPTVRALVHRLDPSVIAREPVSLDALLAATQATRTLTMRLLLAFALTALLLAALGLYGVLAYLVHQRRQEIGIRMALGATPGAVRAQIVVQGLRLCLAGLAIGAVAALVLGRFMASVLFAVSARDPLAFAGAATALGLTSVAACALPAWRAAATDPLPALRE